MLPEDVDSLGEHLEMLPVDLNDACFLSRPGEGFRLEPLYPQAESASIPVEDFHHMSCFSHEDEISTVEYLVRLSFLGQCRQAVYLLPHVCDSSHDIDRPFAFQIHPILLVS